MKRFLLTSSFAVLALGLLNSCQKEEKSTLELTQELTAELQKVTDYKTAEAAAPRVEAINKRFQNASVRPFALNGSALLKTSDDAEAFAQALTALAKEIGRLQASLPTDSYDGEVVQERLLMSVAEAQGAASSSPAAARKSAGLKYLRNDSDANHSAPGTFPDYYGSPKLREAMAYVASPAEVESFESEVVVIPDAVEPAADSTDEAAAEESDAGAEESSSASAAAEDEGSSDTSSDAGSTDDDSSSDTSSDASSTDDDSSSDSSSDAGSTDDDSSSDTSSDAGSSDEDGMLDIEI